MLDLTLECLVCAKPFSYVQTGRGRYRRFCSTDCKRIQARGQKRVWNQSNPNRATENSRPCDISGCKRGTHALGLCSKHYQRQEYARKRGDVPTITRLGQCKICASLFIHRDVSWGKVFCGKKCKAVWRARGWKWAMSEQQKARKRLTVNAWIEENLDHVRQQDRERRVRRKASGLDVYTPRPPRVMHCPSCGTQFETKTTRKFCLECSCGRKTTDSYQRKQTNCLVCGIELPRRGHDRTCSITCHKENLMDIRERNKHSLRARDYRRDHKRELRHLASDAVAALEYMDLVKRPAGMSRDERRKWNEAALRAARSLGINIERRTT